LTKVDGHSVAHLSCTSSLVVLLVIFVATSNPGSDKVVPKIMALKQQLIDRIVELIQGQYKTDEDRALMETFILRLSHILDESKLIGLITRNVWLCDVSLFFQVEAGTPSAVIPGKANPFASVTGNYLSQGGFGTPTDGKLECPRCNGDQFHCVIGEGERMSNQCNDCDYHEDFIQRRQC
jgi:hypothetical protein